MIALNKSATILMPKGACQEPEFNETVPNSRIETKIMMAVMRLSMLAIKCITFCALLFFLKASSTNADAIGKRIGSTNMLLSEII